MAGIQRQHCPKVGTVVYYHPLRGINAMPALTRSHSYFSFLPWRREEFQYMEEPVVGTLLDSFNEYGRFSLPIYYASCFGCLACELKIYLELDRSKDMVDA